MCFNGWLPDEGETVRQLFEQYEGSLVGPAVRPTPYSAADGSGAADLSLDPEAFHAAFAADVERATSDVMAACQRPWNAAAFDAPMPPPAWRGGTPVRYLLGTEDKAIPPALQRFMAERAGASIVEVAASHAAMVSQPDAATRLVLQAVEAVAPALSSA